MTVEVVGVGGEFLVNTNTGGDQSYSAITGLADGGFVVTWQDNSRTLGDNSDWSIKGQLYAADGNRIGSEFLINTYTASMQYQPAVTGLPDGGYVVTWTDWSGVRDGSATSIEGQVFAADGNKIGDQFVVNTQTAGLQTEPAVASLADGSFVVTWQDGSQTLGDASSTSIKGQVFASNGSKLGDEFLINTQTASSQNYPTITGLADGGFAIAWQDSSGTLGDNSSYSIKARLFVVDGTPQDDEFLVNTQTASSQERPAIAGLVDGGFVVTWRDSSGTLGDASMTSVKGQIYAAGGSPVGGEFLVNTQTIYQQSEPAITGLADGGFVVTWQDVGSQFSIRGQVYAADGSRIDDEFLVKAPTDFGEFRPSVSALTAGGFVVSWDSVTDGDALGVKGQIFAVMGVPPVITSDGGGAAAEVSVMEGTTLATIVTATDPDSPVLTYAIAGGPDAALFVIDGATGELSFIAAPAFAAPTDANGDNAYQLTVSVNDGVGIDTQALTVRVTGLPANNPPAGTVTSRFAGGQDGTLQVTQNSLFDPDGMGPLSYQWERDGVAIAGATGVNYTLTQADAGHAVRVVASYTDSYGRAESVAGVSVARTILSVSGQGQRSAIAADETDRLVAWRDVGGPAGQHFRTLPGTTASLTIEWGDATWQGTAAGDAITGVAKVDLMFGGAGNDTLDGGAGNDVLDGGRGNDTLIGGSGSDTARYADAINAVVANLVTGTAYVDAEGSDALSSIENLIGSAYNDWLTGSTAANTLTGGAGNDSLAGGDGNDTLLGGLGNDSLAGGNGTDTASYADATAAVTVRLALNGAQDTGGAGIDALATIESVTGSSFADTLQGNGSDNTLTGGDGNDNLLGGLGDDYLIGGAGQDTVSYITATSGITLDLAVTAAQATGGAGSDRILQVENIRGSAYADRLRGSAAVNSINAAEGDDVVYGFGGNDTLVGGSGMDTLYGGDSQDSVQGGEDSDTIFGEAGLDNLKGDVGNDTIRGGTENDTINGGEGDDVLYGEMGRDVLLGDLGADRFIYTTLAESLTGAGVRDQIRDFSHAQGDRIDLSAIDAVAGGADNAFAFIGTTGFTRTAGQLRAFLSGTNWVVEGDVDGDGAADFAIQVTSASALVSTDFVL